jgi:N-acetylneuraminic acid mutarotase
MTTKHYSIFMGVLLAATLCNVKTASAHFPWLDMDASNSPVMYFGETIADRTYPLPESMADYSLTYVQGETRQKLALKPVEGDDLIGLRATAALSTEAMANGGVIEGTQVYGVHNGSKLTYYTQHFVGHDPSKWTVQSTLGLSAKIAAEANGGIVVSVTSKGEPLSDCDVKLFCDEGHEEGTQTLSDQGIVRFSASQLESGLNGLVFGFSGQENGTVDAEKYTSTSDYMTVTFHWSEVDEPSTSHDKTSKADSKMNSNEPPALSMKPTSFPELPLELTSFGGTIAKNHLFLYGGHTGSAHSYSTEEQSNEFWSLDLANPTQWEKLKGGPRLQGLALVPYGDSVVRIGGFTALNDEGEEQDLQSQTSVSRYSMATKTWSDLASLPEPRSSLGATVVGDTVYVVGGWSMVDGETVWHETAWSLDLSDSDAQWQAIAEPPFQRRALWVATHNDFVYAVGGMDKESGPTTETYVYDPNGNTWTQGPSLAGDPMTGFGCAAQSHDGSLFVSTISGNLQRLDSNSDQWSVVGTLSPSRFFHCMLPTESGELMLVGGANMEIGKFTKLETIELN